MHDKGSKKPRYAKKHGSKITQYVFYINCVMERQWHARRQNNPGRQKNPAAKNPDFNCTTKLKFMVAVKYK